MVFSVVSEEQSTEIALAVFFGGFRFGFAGGIHFFQSPERENSEATPFEPLSPPRLAQTRNPFDASSSLALENIALPIPSSERASAFVIRNLGFPVLLSRLVAAAKFFQRHHSRSLIPELLKDRNAADLCISVVTWLNPPVAFRSRPLFSVFFTLPTLSRQKPSRRCERGRQFQDTVFYGSIDGLVREVLRDPLGNDLGNGGFDDGQLCRQYRREVIPDRPRSVGVKSKGFIHKTGEHDVIAVCVLAPLFTGIFDEPLDTVRFGASGQLTGGTGFEPCGIIPLR